MKSNVTLPMEEGLYHNPAIPGEYIDVRYLPDANNPGISVHVKVVHNGDEMYGSCVANLKGLLVSKVWELVLERVDNASEDGLSSWGSLWIQPSTTTSFKAQILANPVFRPYSVFVKSED